MSDVHKHTFSKTIQYWTVILWVIKTYRNTCYSKELNFWFSMLKIRSRFLCRLSDPSPTSSLSLPWSHGKPPTYRPWLGRWRDPSDRHRIGSLTWYHVILQPVGLECPKIALRSSGHSLTLFPRRKRWFRISTRLLEHL